MASESLSDPRKLLTRREREVIELLRSGLTRNRVADKLFVDLATIHKHVNNCLYKTGHHNLSGFLTAWRWKIKPLRGIPEKVQFVEEKFEN